MFDDSTPDFGKTCFVKVDWSEYCPDAVELILLKMLKPHGKAVTTHVLLMLIMLDAMLLDHHKLVF